MRKKDKHIVSMELDLSNPPALTPKQRKELAALSKMTDDQIDYSDIPKLPESFLRKGLYRPVKRQVTVRIDADILEWLRSQGTGHHSRLNQILRSAMLSDLANAARRLHAEKPGSLGRSSR